MGWNHFWRSILNFMKCLKQDVSSIYSTYYFKNSSTNIVPKMVKMRLLLQFFFNPLCRLLTIWFTTHFNAMQQSRMYVCEYCECALHYKVFFLHCNFRQKKSRLTHFFRKQTQFVTFLGARARENSRKFSSENQMQWATLLSRCAFDWSSMHG